MKGGCAKSLAGLALGALVALGCASHPTRAVGFRTIRIDDRGISIPVPPPSLRARPLQDSKVEGRVHFSNVDDESLELGGTVDVLELSSGAHATVTVGPVFADADGTASVTFEVPSILVDHSDNCFELTLIDHDGTAFEPAYYHTEIQADDQSVATLPGCE